MNDSREENSSSHALSVITPPKAGAVAPKRVHPASLPAADVEALYVHIPFCFHKCHYCDFYSITRQTPARMEGFVDLLLREADFWVDARPRFRTVFFGGGTPSLLPLPSMRRLIEGLRRRFDFSALEEWTVEINPATAELDYCRMLRDSGVDRLSFGAQSFNPAELAVLERHHHPDDVARSIDIARAAGFHRLNVDLIYAIPGQDLASWAHSLEMAVSLKTPHISCYNLTYEPNTPMAVRKRLGQFIPVEESIELQMFHEARRRLKWRGMLPYEISNYAEPGEECRHNLVYWTGGNYIGLGPSAASHVEGHRWKSRSHLGEWERAVAEGFVPTAEFEILPAERRAGELAMLMLRLAGGINYAAFTGKTGIDAREAFTDQVSRFEAVGLLKADTMSICLTETGLNVADAIGAEFLSPA
ncbi:MAG TPA: radical SAM family heme chaperone HemW [Tepidisphaeraceae bacterium]|jgi:oxygen-independent coproporphyrinogen-3 oxidase|nr:radical SAM family heme chaperone HemW [Tepidisphaeraceae bacterium]